MRGGLLPLDGARRLGGDVVDDTVDPVDTIDDTCTDLFQKIVREVCERRRHPVSTLDRTD